MRHFVHWFFPVVFFQFARHISYIYQIVKFTGANLGFKKALLRALAKNLLMALLFPFCFAMFFFRSNRTSYDIMTKTIVVEENAAPVLRRR